MNKTTVNQGNISIIDKSKLEIYNPKFEKNVYIRIQYGDVF